MFASGLAAGLSFRLRQWQMPGSPPPRWERSDRPASFQMPGQSPGRESGPEREARDRAEAVRRRKADKVESGDRAFEVARQHRRIRRGAKLGAQRRAEEAKTLD